MTDAFIPFARPDITEAEINAVVEVVRSGWLTTGPRTKDFERRFAESTGVPHAIMVNSCTAALHIALEAIGVRRGDEVILPTMTFAATAEVVRYFDAVPVLVDVRPEDHNIDPAAVERAITPKTRAIIPVHFAGAPCNMDEILAIARPRSIPVVVDSAHCFPGTYRDRNVGTVGDIVCFSFYATKTITTGEGGAAVTSNDEWAERMRIMSLHGISKDAWKRYTAEGSWYYEIVAPGFKYNLTDMASALGVVQLGRAEEMRKRRQVIAERYRAAFADLDALEFLRTEPDRSHSHHLFVIKLVDGVLSIGRDRFIEELKKLGVGTSVHFIPLHTHPYYRSLYGFTPEAFPNAYGAYQRSISLPIYSSMTDAEIDRVAGAVRDVVLANRR